VTKAIPHCRRLKGLLGARRLDSELRRVGSGYVRPRVPRDEGILILPGRRSFITQRPPPTLSSAAVSITLVNPYSPEEILKNLSRTRNSSLVIIKQDFAKMKTKTVSRKEIV